MNKIEEIKRDADRLFTIAVEVSKDSKNWRMCIPVRPDDSDRVLCRVAHEHIPWLLNENERLRKAMRADIGGAGKMTGPIYHQNIRRALRRSGEESGA